MLSKNESISLRDILCAKKRISPYIKETPLIKSNQLSSSHDAEVYLKYEQLQPTGSFKLRGATNKLLALTEEERMRGVTTFSTGNHGLAVAHMAKQIKTRAVICISNRVPAAKVEKLEKLGAEIVKVGKSQDEAEIYAYELKEQAGLTVIPPFDDPDIIAGQGTIGIELISKVPELDSVIIPVSGGGLFSGISYFLKQYNPSIEVIGVSMRESAVMYESLKAGRIVQLEESNTIADSLLGGIGSDNHHTFTMVKKYIDDFVLLTEEEIAAGIHYMLDEHKIAVEGASATTIAAILHKRVNVKGKTVGCIITGNNIDTPTIIRIAQQRK